MNDYQRTVAAAEAMATAHRAIDREDTASVYLTAGRMVDAAIAFHDAAELWTTAAALIRNAGGDRGMARDYATRARQDDRAADRARVAVAGGAA
jgi:hypothetical protein